MSFNKEPVSLSPFLQVECDSLGQDITIGFETGCIYKSLIHFPSRTNAQKNSLNVTFHIGGKEKTRSTLTHRQKKNFASTNNPTRSRGQARACSRIKTALFSCLFSTTFAGRDRVICIFQNSPE